MPPAAEPIREQIIAAIVTRLEGITAGSDFWYTPGEVSRDWKSYQEVLGFPFYGVIDGDESTQEQTNCEVTETFNVIIVGWLKDDNRRRAVNRAIADLKVAIFSTVISASGHTLGVTEVVRSLAPSTVTDEAALVAKPFGYFEFRLPVEYDRQRSAA